MNQPAHGSHRQTVAVPPRGERVAAYVEAYLAAHRGLSLGELSFRLRADKRDVQRLLRDRSCGARLEDSLAAYFGRDFGEAVFGPLWGCGPSIRERELEGERAAIAARRERLERLRTERRSPAYSADGGLADDEDRQPGVSRRG
jgi:hypothetical protein